MKNFTQYSAAQCRRKFNMAKSSSTKKPANKICGLFREPGGIRTPNLLIRSQMHYPIMLRVPRGSRAVCFLNAGCKSTIFSDLSIWNENFLPKFFIRCGHSLSGQLLTGSNPNEKSTFERLRGSGARVVEQGFFQERRQ